MNADDIRALRKRLQLSQEDFACQFGFNLGTVRHWEQGSRGPDQAACTLLKIIAKYPEIVLEVVAWKSGKTSQDVMAIKPVIKAAFDH